MEGIKRFISMFLASLAIFMVLAYVDEYQNLIAPFLKKETGTRIPYTADLEVELKKFIQTFNASLSQAYRSSDPLSLDTLPVDGALKKAMAEEMFFLMGGGKVMDVNVEDIKVEGVERVSSTAVTVKTRELVSLSYLNLSDGTVIMPRQDAVYQMSYTLEVRDERWVLVRYVTVGVEGVKSSGSGSRVQSPEFKN